MNSPRYRRSNDPRGRQRRRTLVLEPLEDRVALSLTPQMVLDINANNASSNPSALVAVGSTTYFTADDGVHGNGLWKTDGTATGTVLVKDINPGSYSYLGELTNLNGTLFFTANDGTGRKLWKSDGTTDGTVWVSSLPSNPSSLTAVNGTLFFTADDGVDGVHNTELWKSDGTEAGTTLVKDIYPGASWKYYTGYWYGSWIYAPNSSNPSYLTNAGGTLFFTANDGLDGAELWKSDGTAAGTVLVEDIWPGSDSSYPKGVTNVGGTLFFSARDGLTTGWELWRSDGTAAGTSLVKDILPGSDGSYPQSLANVNGTLFFRANDGVHGNELWKSDGTEAGTALLKDILPGGGGSFPDWLTNVNGTLFFRAYDDAHGNELWKSDGTAVGTVPVKDAYPGAAGSFPDSLTNVDGTLCFVADDGTAVRKLWQSDGTAAGTVLVTNFAVSSLTTVNGTLFFAADDGIHGVELWTLVDDHTQPPPTLSINEVTVVEGNSGTRSATFTVTLSAPATVPVTVNYATANGTATAPADYTAAAGTLTFAPGETSKTIAVLVQGDRLGEPDETFSVNLSAATNATIADSQAVGTILDDEPRVTIGDVALYEGQSGATAFVFTVTLSVPYDITVNVSFATANGTAKVSDSDYTATSGTLSFAPGQTTKTITVMVKGDTRKEADETFLVNLTSASSAVIIDGQGVGTIVNDDRKLRGKSRLLRSTSALAPTERSRDR